MLLATRQLGESDLIAIGFGPKTGKFSAVVRRGKGGQRGSIGLFDPPTEVVARFCRREALENLTQPVLRRSFPGLKSSLKHLLAAGFFARLWLAAWPERDPCASHYQDMQSLLGALNDGLDPVGVGLLGQHLLLERLGLGLSFQACLDCGGEGLSRFFFEDGGLRCAQCAGGQGLPVGEATLRLLREVDFQVRQQRWDFRPVRDRSVAEVGLVYREQFRFHLEVPESLFRPLYRRKTS